MDVGQAPPPVQSKQSEWDDAEEPSVNPATYFLSPCPGQARAPVLPRVVDPVGEGITSLSLVRDFNGFDCFGGYREWRVKAGNGGE